MTVAMMDKAARLLLEDRVQPLPGARVYRVASEHHAYTVVLAGNAFTSCSCPTRGVCSHITAALGREKGLA